MPTPFGFTALGEHLPITSEPFLEFRISRQWMLDEASPADLEVVEYFRRGAQQLQDTWTMGLDYRWDALVFRCWIPGPTLFEREVSLAA